MTTKATKAELNKPNTTKPNNLRVSLLELALDSNPQSLLETLARLELKIVETNQKPYFDIKTQ